MFANERSLTKWIIKSLESYDLSLVNVLSGNAISKRAYEGILAKYFGSYTPMIVAKPDIVLVVEDPHRLTDEWFLTAIELKYFREIGGKRWREAYREIGQALRYYMYGFDLAILWHIFSREINDNAIRAYSNVVGEVIEKLKLPIVYFSTKIVDKDKFLVYKPLELTRSSDLRYIVSWMLNYRRSRVRNPLLPSDKVIVERRKALKTVLKIP